MRTMTNPKAQVAGKRQRIHYRQRADWCRMVGDLHRLGVNQAIHVVNG